MENPKEKPKQETLEEAGKDFIENSMKFSFKSLETRTQANRMLKCIEFGAKYQAKRMYSEEEVRNLINRVTEFFSHHNPDEWDEWIEKQFKKN